MTLTFKKKFRCINKFTKLPNKKSKDYNLSIGYCRMRGRSGDVTSVSNPSVSSQGLDVIGS